MIRLSPRVENDPVIRRINQGFQLMELFVWVQCWILMGMYYHWSFYSFLAVPPLLLAALWGTQRFIQHTDQSLSTEALVATTTGWTRGNCAITAAVIFGACWPFCHAYLSA